MTLCSLEPTTTPKIYNNTRVYLQIYQTASVSIIYDTRGGGGRITGSTARAKRDSLPHSLIPTDSSTNEGTSMTAAILMIGPKVNKGEGEEGGGKCNLRVQRMTADMQPPRVSVAAAAAACTVQ